jgi:hypothetical protein
MDKLDKIMRMSMAKKGMRKVTQGAQICFYAEEWAKGRFVPISYLNGTLKIAVTSSSAASEMQMEIENLLDFVNEKIRYKVLHQVRIIIKKDVERDYR